MIFLWLMYVMLGNAEMKQFTLKGRAQGTTYMIRYTAADSMLRKLEVDSLFRAIDLSLSLYEPTSLISRFNRDGKVVMDDHMQKVVKASLQLYHSSDGAFDITTKPLSAYWGFGPQGSKPMNLRAARKLTGSNKIKVRDSILVAGKKGMMIDCNGIAQGYTVDVIAGLLESRGVQDLLVELGGEIRVGGRADGKRKWTVGLESPETIAGEWRVANKMLELENRSITTSGSYRNYVERGGKRYGHVIDPVKGKPVDNGVISVTVVARTAMEADGLDNALFVKGWQQSLQWLQKRQDVEAYFVYADRDGRIRDTATLGFYALVR